MIEFDQQCFMNFEKVKFSREAGMGPIAQAAPVSAAATIRGGTALDDILSIRRQILEVSGQQSSTPMRIEDRRNAAAQLNSRP
ncbi:MULTISPECIES: hypothetical protein [unclassified Burkholderia]|uniref:hypothetical protein n=2 Tax=unclassified Burkholderia TaxID=2613784 RepID=UPI0012E3E599|nr:MULTISPECIES: hypothetical protein [unclassified Burkholderia]